MDGLTILQEAREAGLEITIDGERLVVRGPKSAAPIAERLLRMKQEIMAVIVGRNEAVEWRIEAMRPQVPRTGAIPCLLARPEAKTAPAGMCVSCGDPLAPDRRIRCVPCVEAIERLLNELREGHFGASRR
jgi:hypothetical protein